MDFTNILTAAQKDIKFMREDVLRDANHKSLMIDRYRKYDSGPGGWL